MNDKSKSAFPSQLPYIATPSGLNGGGPITDLRQYENTAPFEGMTLREFYAGMAMQGFCTNPSFSDWKLETAAKSAVMQADALIAALATGAGA